MLKEEAEDVAPNAVIVAANRWYGKLDQKMRKKRPITKRNQTLTTAKKKNTCTKRLHNIISQCITTLLKKLLKKRRYCTKSRSLLRKQLKNPTRKKLRHLSKSNKIKILEGSLNNQWDSTPDL